MRSDERNQTPNPTRRQAPNQRWVCGRSSESIPCRLGPSGLGECGEPSVCIPEREDNEYRCSRPSVAGGLCSEGPLADGACGGTERSCRPRRSVSDQRRHLAMVSTVIAFAFCFVLLGETRPSAWISPGALADAHRFLEEDCAACHTAADGASALSAFGRSAGEIGQIDSDRCVACHDDLGIHRSNPHGLASAELQERREGGKAASDPSSEPLELRLVDLLFPRSTPQSLACATCHHEHRGREVDPTRLTDPQCQSCHRRRFHSFEVGHPDFEPSALARPPAIRFDHARHLKKHFVDEEFGRLMPDGAAPTSCTNCHEFDRSKRSSSLRRFDQMCASCHESTIVDQAFPGVPFFAVPDLATGYGTETDDNAIESIGQWPAARVDLPVPEIPPFMEMLLLGDPEYEEAVAVLGDSAFRRLSVLRREHPGAVAKYAWSIKRAIDDVVRNGEAALERRLGAESGRLASMRPSIVEAFVTLQRSWFPRLRAEMKARRAGRSLEHAAEDEPSGPSTERISSAEMAAGGGWHLKTSDRSIRYRPIGHADQVMKAWLDRCVAADGVKRVTTSRDRPLRRLWEVLGSPSASGHGSTRGPVASGRCMQCHTTEDGSQADHAVVNWRADPPAERIDRLTEFSHAPHLAGIRGESCSHCHRIDTTVERADPFSPGEPSERAGVHTGFRPITKATCVACHHADGVSDSCSVCHNYHAHRSVSPNAPLHPSTTDNANGKWPAGRSSE